MPTYRTIPYHDEWLKLTEAEGGVFAFRLDFRDYLGNVPGPGACITRAKAHVPYSPFQHFSLCGINLARRLGIETDQLEFGSVNITARKSSKGKPQFKWMAVQGAIVTIDGVRFEEISEFLQVPPGHCARTKPIDDFTLLVAETIPKGYICIGHEFFDSHFDPIRGFKKSRLAKEVFYQTQVRIAALCDQPRTSSTVAVI